MRERHLSAGDLIHRVVLQRATSALDEYNSPVQDWQPVGTYWALVEPLQGREQYYAQQVLPLSNYKITMRQVCPVFDTDRFSWQGLTLNIGSVVPVDGRREFFEIMAIARQPTA